MYFKECNEKVNIPKILYEKYNLGQLVFFDIETTGFDRNKDSIILISIGSFQDNEIFHIEQFFSSNREEEGEILYSLKKALDSFNGWCSYNGIAFDEPFILSRMQYWDIEFTPPKTHVDLYRLIKPFYKEIGLERCNLKTVEKYLGINRQDQIDGGESVQLYEEYLANEDLDIRDIILLHNFEDVLNLPKIFNILLYIEKNNLKRSDLLSEKQLKFLLSLIKKNKIKLDFQVETISKSSASKLIDTILKGETNSENLKKIVASL